MHDIILQVSRKRERHVLLKMRKKPDEIRGIHNEEAMFGGFETHRAYGNQENQRETTNSFSIDLVTSHDHPQLEETRHKMFQSQSQVPQHIRV